MFKTMMEGAFAGLLCVLLAIATACGGGGGNDAGTVGEGAPENANEVADAWSDAAEKCKAIVGAAKVKVDEIKKLPKAEQSAPSEALMAEMTDEYMKVLSALPPLEIRSLSPEVLEVSSVGKVSGVSLSWGTKVKVPISFTVRKEINEVELRLHGSDGSVLSKSKTTLRKLAVGEKEVVTVGFEWEPEDTTKRAIAYGTVRVVDPTAAPAGNVARAGNFAPAGNTR